MFVTGNPRDDVRRMSERPKDIRFRDWRDRHRMETINDEEVETSKLTEVCCHTMHLLPGKYRKIHAVSFSLSLYEITGAVSLIICDKLQVRLNP